MCTILIFTTLVSHCFLQPHHRVIILLHIKISVENINLEFIQYYGTRFKLLSQCASATATLGNSPHGLAPCAFVGEPP